MINMYYDKYYGILKFILISSKSCHNSEDSILFQRWTGADLNEKDKPKKRWY